MQNRKTKRRRIVVVFVAQLLLFSFSSSYSDLASHSRLSAKEWNQFPSDGVIACWSLFVRRIEEAESYFVRHEQCSEPPDQRQRRTKCKNLGDECAVWVCVRYTSYVVGAFTAAFTGTIRIKASGIGSSCTSSAAYNVHVCFMVRTLAIVVNRLWIMNMNHEYIDSSVSSLRFYSYTCIARTQRHTVNLLFMIICMCASVCFGFVVGGAVAGIANHRFVQLISLLPWIKCNFWTISFIDSL